MTNSDTFIEKLKAQKTKNFEWAAKTLENKSKSPKKPKINIKPKLVVSQTGKIVLSQKSDCHIEWAAKTLDEKVKTVLTRK